MWNVCSFSCSMRMPPWLWVIAFGSPVVPEENKIHSGWPNGTCSNSNSAAGTGGWSMTWSQAWARGSPGIACPAGPGTWITCSRPGSSAMICSISALRS